MEQLQEYLVKKFQFWQPQAPEVVERTKRSVTLKLNAEPFAFMGNHLIYSVQRKEKIPPWVTVYSGGKTTKSIEDLASSHPHKFRLQVIVKSTAVPLLAEEAVKHYRDEDTIFKIMKNIACEQTDKKPKKDCGVIYKEISVTSIIKSDETLQEVLEIPKEQLETCPETQETLEQYILGNKKGYTREETNDSAIMRTKYPITLDNKDGRSKVHSSSPGWLPSRWSEQTWTSTDTDGTSAMCFCMAIRCGYFKQVQVMLEERPVLIGAINSISGLTPLATAVKKGDLNTVKFVLSLEAEVDQPTSASQTPLHLAVLAGHTAIVDALLEKGADFQAQDLNGLRVEHFAVDSCSVAMVNHVMDRGGDVGVKDSNGWTPLFRAVCQGATTEVIEELMRRGSSVTVLDRRGLALVAAARLLRNRQYGLWTLVTYILLNDPRTSYRQQDAGGRSRDSVLRLVDAQFPHEKALANFTRLTKKIYSVHTLLK